LKSRDDLESQLIIANVYSGIADYYTERKDYKMAHLYADKSIMISEKIPLNEYLSAKKMYRNRPFIYFHKSWIFLQEKILLWHIHPFRKGMSWHFLKNINIWHLSMKPLETIISRLMTIKMQLISMKNVLKIKESSVNILHS
jgi:hypothetical protein